VGVFLFVWLIRKFIARRRDREEEEYEPVQTYSGPDRGKLYVKSGPLAGEIFYLTEDVITIGSIDSNDIIIEDEGISRRHAGIKIEEMRYELADFGSTNGTWVNGRKINKQFLKDGDEIRIGDTELEFALR
jgi:pSer/pThr/pTyr-binding forkhead associated (FHA) protein